MKATLLLSGLLSAVCSALTGTSFAQTSDSVIQPPSADVPAACAAFSGGWSGEWPRFGRIYLWVVSIAPDCKAQVLYGKTAKPTSSEKLSPATIKANTLSLPRPDGGTTTFEMGSDALNAQYTGPSPTNAATMYRIDLDTAVRLDAEQTAMSATVPLLADVPAECARFHGQWVGTWSAGNFGEMFLRVAEVKSAGDKCVVRYSYSSAKSPVPAKMTAEVRNGTVAFGCGMNGTCVFERHGDDLWASYTNPSGGINNAAFRKVK
jgi:hypothetical protein